VGKLRSLLDKKKTATTALVGGSLAASYSPDTEATFLRAAGPTVRNAPKSSYKATEENLEKALSMFEKGVDPREIYEETGFFKGADGKLRFEISDKGVVYKPERDRDLIKDSQGNLVSRGRLFSEAVDHPSFEPEVGGGPPSNRIIEDDAGNIYEPTIYEFAPDGESHAGFVRDGEMHLAKQYMQPEMREKMLDVSPWKESTQKVLDELSPESIVMHEQQHVIQDRMGLARGGNTRTARRSLTSDGGFKIDSDLITKKNEASLLSQQAGNLNDLEIIMKYRNYAKEGLRPDSNLTGKQRLLFGNSSWYEYGDKIRSTLGPQPKRHRPKHEREQWLSSAWAELANHMENELYPTAKVDALRDLGMLPSFDADPNFSISKANEMYDQLVIDGTLQSKDLKNAINRKSRKLDKLRPDAMEARKQEARKQQILGLSDEEIYHNLAGEVEARNTQSRLNMSMDERYGSYPKDTEDVPRESQIIMEDPLSSPNEARSLESNTNFAATRDSKNNMWDGLKRSVSQASSVMPQQSFIADTAETMGRGLVSGTLGVLGNLPMEGSLGRMGLDYFGIGPEQIEGYREDIKADPLFEDPDNPYSQALNRAMETSLQYISPYVSEFTSQPEIRATLGSIGDWYSNLSPRSRGILSGAGEYLANLPK